MTDVALVYKNQGYDINYFHGELESDEGLETAVIISLFSDRRVLPEEIDKNSDDLRGWWGDEFSETPGDQIGSRLWLLDRSKIGQETRNRVQEYASEALDWLTDSGVADSVTVTAAILNGNEAILLSIEITRPKNRTLSFYRFQLVWDGQLLKLRKA